MQAESGACKDDFIRKTVENDAGEGRDAVRADQNVSYQPGADHAAEAQRERQHAHNGNVLPDHALPRRGRDGVYRRVKELRKRGAEDVAPYTHMN